MNKRKSTNPKEIIFNSVKEKLEYIQKNCLEPVLFEYLQQLFKNKGFQNVKITHGNNEYGKDLVFSKYDSDFEEDKWFCAIVKNKPAKQNDFLPGGEIGMQIQLASTRPYKDLKGIDKRISRFFIIINGNVTKNCIDVIGDNISDAIKENIKIWDYQDLEREFSTNCKEEFLDNKEPILNTFIKEQIKQLSDISSFNDIYDLKIDDIDEIFINVQTSFSKEIRKINEYLTFDEKDSKLQEGEFDISKEIISSSKNYIIHGIPTSGKTILLKRTGLLALTNNSDTKTGVFYLDINDQNFNINIDDLIQEQYKGLTSGDPFNVKEFNKLIVLVDSVDFISNEDDRLEFLNKIDEFSKSNFHDNIQIIIATRHLNFAKNNSKLENFEDVEILPFNFNQAVKLVKKIIPNDNNKANTFLRAIKNSLLDTSLQRTPLSLTLIATMYRDDKVDLKELPANIFELYNKFTDIYLDRWDSNKGVNSQYKYEQLKLILGFVSYRMHDEGRNTISSELLKEYLNDLRKSYSYEELDDVDNFIEYLKTKRGVINYEVQGDSFHFFNHFFQEFFASLILDDENDDILIDNFLTEWWDNAQVFYCGKEPKKFSFHKKILEKVIPLNSWDNMKYLNQHSKCLQASHAVSISNRELVAKKLLKQFNEFIEQINIGARDESSVFHGLPFVNIINQSRIIFNQTFSSKHIATEEIFNYLQNTLIEGNKNYNLITLYNIAYFIAFKSHDGTSFEIFSELINDDVVWNRILYVDINFLKLKKQVDDKVYLRLKRKMTKNKFLIQEVLRNQIDLTKNDLKLQ
ncbi:MULTISPECIES: NACHT domain-containing protein [Sphingobacterium]|uniref:NACHT domain-containing protein n=1 Tax=Sphingobacterium TaxID=28453 RepID=UPI00257FB821|nr:MULTISPECIES: hypothetical protein [Sphingobacterium]